MIPTAQLAAYLDILTAGSPSSFAVTVEGSPEWRSLWMSDTSFKKVRAATEDQLKAPSLKERLQRMKRAARRVYVDGVCYLKSLQEAVEADDELDP